MIGSAKVWARATPEQVAGRILIAVNVCFFFSGATGLLYQVLWVRMLAPVFGHTVFAITTALAAFMGGLGLGSYVFGRRVDRHDEAITTLKRALTLDERNEHLHFRLGEVYAQVKQYDAAAQEFGEAVRLNPLVPAAYVELGRLHLLRGELAKAMDAWEGALRLDPSNASLRQQLEELYATAS